MFTDEGSSSEEDQQAPHRKYLLKPGKVHTVDSLVTKHVTWPHVVVYTMAGKVAVYDYISMPLFIQGYLIVMEGEKEAVKTQMNSHLNDLMADSELHG